MNPKLVHRSKKRLNQDFFLINFNQNRSEYSINLSSFSVLTWKICLLKILESMFVFLFFRMMMMDLILICLLLGFLLLKFHSKVIKLLVF